MVYMGNHVPPGRQMPAMKRLPPLLRDPDLVGTTEYRAIYEALMTGALNLNPDLARPPTSSKISVEQLTHMQSMLEEFSGYVKELQENVSRRLHRKLSAAQRYIVENFPVNRCDNCGKIWTSEEIREPIRDLAQRVDPGGVVPAGECKGPECGALCYPVEHAHYWEALRKEISGQSTLRLAANQATGCSGADSAWARVRKYSYILAWDTTSSAGDWTFLVSEDGFHWNVLYQSNNYPKPGFTHTLDDMPYAGTFNGAYLWLTSRG